VAAPTKLGTDGDSPRITRDTIAETLDGVAEATIADILATGATVKEFEEAVAWASDESDVMGKAGRPVSGAVATIYEILVSREHWEEPDERA
jgi:hypothetical protein